MRIMTATAVLALFMAPHSVSAQDRAARDAQDPEVSTSKAYTAGESPAGLLVDGPVLSSDDRLHSRTSPILSTYETQSRTIPHPIAGLSMHAASCTGFLYDLAERVCQCGSPVWSAFKGLSVRSPSTVCLKGSACTVQLLRVSPVQSAYKGLPIQVSL